MILCYFKSIINCLCVIDDNHDEERVGDIIDHSEDSTGSDLLLNSDESPDRNGALNLVNFIIKHFFLLFISSIEYSVIIYN